MKVEGGSGEGEEGEVIGEQPVREEQGGQGGAGQGRAAATRSNPMPMRWAASSQSSSSFPTCETRARRRSFTKYTYDLTDKNRGFGQVLDKKATLRRIIQTNIGLGTDSGKASMWIPMIS